MSKSIGMQRVQDVVDMKSAMAWVTSIGRDEKIEDRLPPDYDRAIIKTVYEFEESVVIDVDDQGQKCKGSMGIPDKNLRAQLIEVLSSATGRTLNESASLSLQG